MPNALRPQLLAWCAPRRVVAVAACVFIRAFGRVVWPPIPQDHMAQGYTLYHPYTIHYTLYYTL